MVLASERLLTILDFDERGAIRGMEKTAKAADRELGKVENKVDATAAKLTKFGAASLAAAGVMAAGLASTIGAASDLNEAINVNQLTFGDAADEMERWGDTAAESIGQSKRAALEGAAAVGGLLQNVGFLQDEAAPLSRELVGLAADMASAFNTDPAEALEAIRSGLSGQSEPLRRYNVFLSEAAVKQRALEDGLWDGTGALTENEKAQGRLNIIMEQTARIQGDFAATSDGAANAQRVFNAQLEDFKASVGQSVLPIFEGLLSHANNLLSVYNALTPEQKELVSQVLLFGTAIVALNGGMSLLVGKAIKARGALQNIATNGFSKAQLAAGGLTAAVGLGLVALDQYRSKVEANRRAVKAWAEVLRNAENPIEAIGDHLESIATDDGNFRDLFATIGPEAVRALTEEIAESGTISDQTIRSWEDLGASWSDVMITAKDLRDQIEAGTISAEQLATAFDTKINPSFIEFIDPANAVSRAAGMVVDGLDKAQNSAAIAGIETNIMRGELLKTIEPFESLEDIISRVNGELATYYGTIRSDFDLITDTEEAIDGLVDSFKENGVSLDETTKKGLKNRNSYSRLIGVVEDVHSATLEHTGSMEAAQEAAEGVIQSFIDQATEAGLSEEAIRGVIDELLAVPSEATASVDVDTDSAAEALKSIQGVLDYIDNNQFTGNLRMLIPGGFAPSPQPQSAPPAPPLDLPGTQGGPGPVSGGSLVLHSTIQLDGVEVGRAVGEATTRDGGTPFLIEGGR